MIMLRTMHGFRASLSCMTTIVAICSWCHARYAPAAEPEATPAAAIVAPPGFKVELLRSAKPGEGSWISMAFDDRGRLILGRDAAGIARLTLADDPEETRYETLNEELRHCRGVLYAYESIYVCATNSNGFYRLRDSDGDGAFDDVRLLKAMDYRSRYGHGTNQVLLGPDDMIYVVNGNDVSFPEGCDPKSPYRNPRNDHLLPNPHDAGHDDRVGHILRTDRDGKQWTVLAGGLRNQYDIAFDEEGEMFTFDADMEWDVGLPWYRPTRVNHLVSGGEYGWRWGTGKWPAYFADSLPSTLDCGLGSPTGVVFGTRSRFPQRYRRTLFMADWQHGRILAADLLPAGASYAARYDLFLEGAPLNVCDLEFGPDGALYFITGGRGSQSGLYRVSWIGSDEDAAKLPPAPPSDDAAADHGRQMRALRKRLEAWHTQRDEAAVDEIWPHLDSDDRWLQFAARVALENQPVAAWRGRALSERKPTAAGAALLALARQGEPADLAPLLDALERLPLESRNENQATALLRTWQLAFIRLQEGQAAENPPAFEPPRIDRQRIASHLESLPPSTPAIRHLQGELLVYLGHPPAVDRLIGTLAGDAATTQEEQVGAARTLTHAQHGWSPASRRAMLLWLNQARRFQGGKLVKDAIRDIKSDFLATLSDAERELLREPIAALEQPLDDIPSGPPRALVRRWTLDELVAAASQAAAAGHSRSYDNGRQALLAAACLKCHRLGDSGGQIGPDLSQVGRRFDDRALLQSIVDPAAAIDPKYRHTVYVLSTGKIVIGRAAQVGAAQIVVETDPLAEKLEVIPRAEIEETYPATTSPMPSGLVDVLQLDEILDLLAMLKSGGDPRHPIFQPDSAGK